MRIKKIHLYTMGGLITLVMTMTLAIPLILAVEVPPPPDCYSCGEVSWDTEFQTHRVTCWPDQGCTCGFLYDGGWQFDYSNGCAATCLACLGGPGLTKAPPAAIWLADVCEPNDGFSENGEMTLDTNLGGPLEVAASMEGPWYAVEVNGPPWVVTEETLASFAAMVGVDDWHDLWVRANECYPQHLGNLIADRGARMDELCE